MWASGANKLRTCLHFHIPKLLFLSIFCWSVNVLQKLCRYKWHTCRLTCTDRFLNVPAKLRFFFWRGNPCLPPPPPSSYAGRGGGYFPQMWLCKEYMKSYQDFGWRTRNGGHATGVPFRPAPSGSQRNIVELRWRHYYVYMSSSYHHFHWHLVLRYYFHLYYHCHLLI